MVKLATGFLLEWAIREAQIPVCVCVCVVYFSLKAAGCSDRRVYKSMYPGKRKNNCHFTKMVHSASRYPSVPDERAEVQPRHMIGLNLCVYVVGQRLGQLPSQRKNKPKCHPDTRHVERHFNIELTIYRYVLN